LQESTQYQPTKVGFFDKAHQHRKDKEEQSSIVAREVVPILGYSIGIGNQHKTWREQTPEGWRILWGTKSDDTPPPETAEQEHSGQSQQAFTEEVDYNWMPVPDCINSICNEQYAEYEK
jgi:hypothetical protein